MTSRRTAETTGLAVVRFLLDRIDDDEAELDRLARRESRAAAPGAVPSGVQSIERLRANVIARRHLIGDLQQLLVLRDLPSEAPIRAAVLSALFSMCLPHRSHRRFDQHWAALVDGGHGAARAGDEHPLSA